MLLLYATTVIAGLGFLLALVSLYLQRRDKRPRLRVTHESYSAYHGEDYEQVHSFRVVNIGSVNVQVVSLRLIISQTYESFGRGEWLHMLIRVWKSLSRRRETPLPKIEQAEWSGLREGEVELPHNIQPGERVRLTVEDDTLKDILQNAGFKGYAYYKIAVVDTLSRRHMAYGSLALIVDAPED